MPREAMGVREKVFLGVVVLVFLVILVLSGQGKEQDERFKQDYLKWAKAQELLSQKEYAEAEKLLAELLQRHRDSHRVVFLYAVALGEQGKYQESLNWLTEEVKMRRAVLADNGYLFYRASVLYRMGRKDEALAYLQEAELRARQNGAGEEAMQAIEKMRQAVEKGSQDGR